MEDSRADAKLILEGLKQGGRDLNVMLIADGALAWSYFVEKLEPSFAPYGRPDLILLDLELPSKSGSELITEIKAIAGLKMVPMVILSGSMRSEDTQGCYDRGANAVLHKPPEAEFFISLVNEVVHYWLDVAGADLAALS